MRCRSRSVNPISGPSAPARPKKSEPPADCRGRGGIRASSLSGRNSFVERELRLTLPVNELFPDERLDV